MHRLFFLLSVIGVIGGCYSTKMVVLKDIENVQVIPALRPLDRPYVVGERHEGTKCIKGDESLIVSALIDVVRGEYDTLIEVVIQETTKTRYRVLGGESARTGIEQCFTVSGTGIKFTK